jgi:hypothetical protein
MAKAMKKINKSSGQHPLRPKKYSQQQMTALLGKKGNENGPQRG